MLWRMPRLIRVFVVHIKKAWVLSYMYPLRAQWRHWSDWADAQADLSLCWAHSLFVDFVMRRLDWFCLSDSSSWYECSVCPSAVKMLEIQKSSSIITPWIHHHFSHITIEDFTLSEYYMTVFGNMLIFCQEFSPMCLIANMWATSWETLFLLYGNNKGTDQPVHMRSLISTFVVRCLDSIIPLFAIAEILQVSTAE